MFQLINQQLKFSNNSNDDSDSDSESNTIRKILQQQRFKKFDDKDSDIIYDDIDVLLNQKQKRNKSDKNYKKVSKFARGKTGVFDLEEMLNLLREENLKDIVVIKIPKSLKYCDYKIICTANSQRHIKVFMETLNNIYKLKRNPNDPFLDMTDQSKDWRLIDLNNLIVHVFLQKTRDYYDIETLWAIGEEFDDKCQKSETNIVDEILQKHFSTLNNNDKQKQLSE